MKLPKSFLATLVLFTSFYFSFAQEKSNVELFDNFGAVNCEDIRGRTDNFLVTLRNEPSAVGYIVLYSGINPIKFSFYENAIKSHVKFRRFPEERVKFITAKPQTDFKVEFWIAQNDAKPQIKESETSFILNSNNHYLFANDSVEIAKHKGKLVYFHDSECSIEGLNFSLLAKYLKANPEMNAQIFVYNKKRNIANQVIKLFLKTAKEEYKIPFRRMETSYAGINKEIDGLSEKISTVEIWLVPQKKRN